MNVLGFFKDATGPLTGLSPGCVIREVPGGTIAASGAMVEVGGGFYYYAFSGRNVAVDYAVVCDGGESLDANDRYAIGEIPADAAEYSARIAAITSAVNSIKNAVDIIHAIEGGDWELDADAKQLVYKNHDTSEEIARFNMQDVDGSPSITSMYKRIRV